MKIVHEEKTDRPDDGVEIPGEIPIEFREWLKAEATLRNEEISEILRIAVDSYQKASEVAVAPEIPDGYASIRTAGGRAVLVPTGISPSELRQVARVLEMMRMR